MKEPKYHVGHKTKRILYPILLFIGGLFLFVNIMIRIPMSFSTFVLCHVIYIIALVAAILLFLAPSLYNSHSHWTIDDKRLTFFGSLDFIDRLKYFYNKKSENLFNFSINLDAIPRIRISWNDSPHWPYGSISHHITLTVETMDGSTTTFKALEGTDKEGFCEALDYLQKRGVKIIDEAHILDALKQPDININEYIDKINGEKHD
ncbi:MAG: hypothetical protein ACK5LC_17070 [Coprobacillaceae bacterium]